MTYAKEIVLPVGNDQEPSDNRYVFIRGETQIRIEPRYNSYDGIYVDLRENRKNIVRNIDDSDAELDSDLRAIHVVTHKEEPKPATVTRTFTVSLEVPEDDPDAETRLREVVTDKFANAEIVAN